MSYADEGSDTGRRWPFVSYADEGSDTGRGWRAFVSHVDDRTCGDVHCNEMKTRWAAATTLQAIYRGQRVRWGVAQQLRTEMAAAALLQGAFRGQQLRERNTAAPDLMTGPRMASEMLQLEAVTTIVTRAVADAVAACSTAPTSTTFENFEIVEGEGKLGMETVELSYEKKVLIELQRREEEAAAKMVESAKLEYAA